MRSAASAVIQVAGGDEDDNAYMSLPESASALLSEFSRAQSRPITDHALVQRMFTEATTWINAVHMQHRRLTTPFVDSEAPGNEVYRQEIDLHFMLVALTRLRRAVGLTTRVGAVQDDLLGQLVAFDERVPGLSALRNVAEHFDDYTTNRGRPRDIRRAQPQTWSLGEEPDRGPVWRWLGMELAVDGAHAATALYRSFEKAANEFVG